MFVSGCSIQTESRDAGAFVARWSGGSVTAAEVEAAARKLPPGLREQFQTPAGQSEFARSVLSKKLLVAEARRRQIDRSNAIAEQVREFEERLSVQALLDDEEHAAPAPSEAELTQYFEHHLADFKTPAAVRVARVQLNGSEHDKKLRSKIEALRARLVKGEPVSKVAPEGDGPERTRAGEVGWVTTADNAQSKAALELTTPGQISAVIEGPGSLALLVLLERREARQPSYAEVQSAVSAKYQPTHQRKVFDALIARLTSAAGVEYNDAGPR